MEPVIAAVVVPVASPEQSPGICISIGVCLRPIPCLLREDFQFGSYLNSK